jgi:hypothetical protein
MARFKSGAGAAEPADVAEFVADLAQEMAMMSEGARLQGLAACLRGAVLEARREAGGGNVTPPSAPVRPAA